MAKPALQIATVTAMTAGELDAVFQDQSKRVCTPIATNPLASQLAISAQRTEIVTNPRRGVMGVAQQLLERVDNAQQNAVMKAVMHATTTKQK